MIRTRPRWWSVVGGVLILEACLAGGANAQTSPSDVPSLDAFVWRSIGPVNMAGRITDIEAVEQRPRIVYVGTAGGGVWKTTNNGTTWAPIFDDQPNLSIGDIAIAPSAPDTVWVGTGEANSRQSSSYGAGVYRSTDAGVTWTLMGLEASGAIGRIVIDPNDPNVGYVAAAGDLFKPHPERGLFKTTDGGQTWIRSHVIDDDTGFIDVLMDPTDPRILFAASYQRRRAPFGFNGGGPGSGLWRTADAGRTWQPVTGGLPPTGQWGRTGLTIHRADPRIMYALIEPGRAHVAFDGHRSGDFRPHLFRTDDYGDTWASLGANLPPMGHVNVVREDPRNPRLLYVGTENGFYVSLDAGVRWTRFMNGLPAVASDDLVIHPREQDLVLGTHGRSIYILDDVTPLQQLTPDVLAAEVHLFDVRPGVLWQRDIRATHGGGTSMFRATNPPDGTYISYLLGAQAPDAGVRIEIIDATGRLVRELSGPGEAGLHRVVWDLREASPTQPGRDPTDFGAPARRCRAAWRVRRAPGRRRPRAHHRGAGGSRPVAMTHCVFDRVVWHLDLPTTK